MLDNSFFLPFADTAACLEKPFFPSDSKIAISL